MITLLQLFVEGVIVLLKGVDFPHRLDMCPQRVRSEADLSCYRLIPALKKYDGSSELP